MIIIERRNTIQRDLVLQAVRTLFHPTAEEVYAAVVQQHPTISKATVYRNLNLLIGEGKLRRVVLPGAADCFDHTLSAHYHMKCRFCGKVLDVDLPYQAQLSPGTETQEGFLIEAHDVYFTGLCPQCRRLPGNQSV
ncbi:transcriptional repressor [Oscillospiraceae bacterium MB08-C2-2]|nr:transcriptional repressor [Oscillospiraceae bacterium MB08-C2-2]